MPSPNSPEQTGPAGVAPAPSDLDPPQAKAAPERSSSVGSLISDTVIYGLAKVVDPAIGFLLLPLVTSYLGPADYGVLSLYNATSQVAFVLFSLGVHQAFLRYYTEASDQRGRHAVVNAALGGSLLIWGLVAPLLVLAAEPLSGWLFGGGNAALVYVLVATNLVMVVDAIASNLLQADGRSWLYFLNVVVGSVVVRAIAIGLVLTGMGSGGWIVGEAVGRLLAVAALFVVAFRGIGLTRPHRLTKELLSYGLMLVPAMLSFYFMAVTDKYLIRMIADSPFEKVGMYTVGERIAGIMHLAGLAFVLGWQRFAFRNMHVEEGEKRIAYGLLLYVVAAGWLALTLATLGDDLTRMLVPASFEEGIRVIAPLTLAAFLGGVANLAEIGLHKVKRPQGISALSTVAAVSNVLLNLFAIPRYGIAGAAWATFICQGGRLALMWTASQRSFRLPFDYRRAGMALSAYGAAWALGSMAAPLGGSVLGATQLALSLATPALLWWSGLASEEEKAAVRSALRLSPRTKTPRRASSLTIRGVPLRSFPRIMAPGPPPVSGEPVRVFYCVADHFEPMWQGAGEATQKRRVDAWRSSLPALLGDFRDSAGRRPMHTFFYPLEDYRRGYLDRLSELCDLGLADTEVHLHHDRDTAADLHDKLTDFTNLLHHRHGRLRKRADGLVEYGFIHGNWCLNNSHPDGIWCGVDDETSVLLQTGCYADFTLPSAPDLTQTSTVNSIYYVKPDPTGPKGHNRGRSARVGAPAPSGELLMIQGPLYVNWGDRIAGVCPRIDYCNLQGRRGPSLGRFLKWVRSGVVVEGQPNWRFVKVHTHGCDEANRDILLGSPMRKFHEDLAAYAAGRRDFEYYYVSAWEMASLVHQAERGENTPHLNGHAT